MLSGEQRDATEAFDLSIDRGVIDYSVVSYRAVPQLLPLLGDTDDRQELLKTILIRANDRELFEQLNHRSSAGNHWRQRLTPREREVYSLMVDGLSNRRIAQQLVITESTAKLHVRHILEKLCARSRAEAVAKWRDVLGD
jgi:DNA-binding NarL/FixJ family response regulator